MASGCPTVLELNRRTAWCLGLGFVFQGWAAAATQRQAPAQTPTQGLNLKLAPKSSDLPGAVSSLEWTYETSCIDNTLLDAEESVYIF